MTNLQHRLWLILPVAAIAPPLFAATFTVTTTNISGPGSLPAVIAQANATPGSHVIRFGVTNVITLGLQLPAITNSVAIIGQADFPTIISGGGTLPLFSFGAGTTNTLSRLVLVDGSTTDNGAAINNAGVLNLSSCVLSNNRASVGFGGAVYNTGMMLVGNSIFRSNLATNGGALYSSGSVTISDGMLIQNEAGNGGALFNSGVMVIQRVGVSSNKATLGFGGGIFSSGNLTGLDSTLQGNHAYGQGGYPGWVNASGGGGGGAGLGGGVYLEAGFTALTNCTIAGNTATGGQGGVGLADPGGIHGNGGGNNPGRVTQIPRISAGFGGGGYAQVYSIPGQTFDLRGGFGGGGGGGMWMQGGTGGWGGGNGGTGTSGATAVYAAGGGGAGLGAGSFVNGGSVTLVNCTITQNSATGGAGGQTPASTGTFGGAGSGIGGGVFNWNGTVNLWNTVIANNITADSSPDLIGIFSSSGFNLIGNNQGATNLSILDFQNVPANLGPLQDNGGLTLTCAPLQGSPAIGNGASAGAPGADQRGVPRPQGVALDIGAVEAVTDSPLVTGGAMLQGSGFQLTTILDTTSSYRIQGSVNLTNWTDLTNYVGGGSHRFLDAAATNLNQRFYRTATP